ncbi:MAG: hypothetical protein ACREX9_20825 [Gammaproteobacteria bacterium]
MRAPLVITLSVSLLLGITAVNVNAAEAVVLVCNAGLDPTEPIVARCGKSAGVSEACPASGSSCAEALAGFLTLPAFELEDVQHSERDVLIYTIVRP